MTHGYEYFDYSYEGIDDYDFWTDYEQMEQDIDFDDMLDIYEDLEKDEQEYDIYEQDEESHLW